jgi:RNA polymerase sigma factor (sigma-70 family)
MIIGPLPHMLTLYRQDLSYLQEDERRLLEIPLKVACAFCVKYPYLWQYVMDFVQEGNVQLVEAQANRDPAWSDTRFQGYIARSARGAMYKYIARTRHIYIPPATRLKMKQVGDVRELDQLNKLESHFRWEQLFADTLTILPDQTNMQQAFIAAKQKQVERLLSQLPSKEQIALKLYYGIDEHAHRSIEIGTILQVAEHQAKRLVNQAIKRIRNEQEQPSRELQIQARKQERNERMQAIYQQWLEQGKRFHIEEFACATKCGERFAHQFLKERGVLQAK